MSVAATSLANVPSKNSPKPRKHDSERACRSSEQHANDCISLAMYDFLLVFDSDLRPNHRVVAHSLLS